MFTQDGIDCFRLCSGPEGMDPSQHFIKKHTEGENIGSRVHWAPPKLFWRTYMQGCQGSCLLVSITKLGLPCLV